MATSNDTEIKIRSKYDSKGTDNAKKSFKDMASTIKSTISKISSMVDMVKTLTDETDKFAISGRLMETTFGNLTTKVQKYANSMAKLAGLSEADVYKEMSLIGKTGLALGMSSDNAAKYAQNVATLSAKLSILYNVDYVKMTDSLRAAAKGETETLTSLTGIIAKEQHLQQTLAEIGLKKKVSELNAAEKVMVQYIQITKSATESDENLSNAVNSVAYQKMMLTEQIKRLTASIGNMLYPALQAILPILNAILIVITTIINFITELIGFNIKVSDSVDDISKSYAGLGKNIKKASDAANKSLRGFDKLNNIKTPKTSDSSSSSGGIGISVDPKIQKAFDDMETRLDGIKNKAQEIADKILKWLGFTEDENGKLKWSGDLLKNNILKSLKDNWKIIATIASIVMGIGLAKKLIDISNNSKDAAKAQQTMADAAKKASTALEILAVGIAGLAILAGIAMVLSEVNDLIQTFTDSGMSAWEVAGLLTAVLVPLALAVSGVILAAKTMSIQEIVALVTLLGGLALIFHEINGLIETLNSLGSNTSTVMTELVGILVGLEVLIWSLVGAALILGSNPLALIGIVALAGSLVAILYAMRDTLPIILGAVGNFITNIGPTLIVVINTILSGIEKIIKAIGTTLVDVVKNAGNVFKTIFDGISKVVKTVGDTMSKIFNSLKSLISTTLKSILNFIKDAGPAINKFVDNIISAVTKLINFMISAIEYLVNKLVISSMKTMIKAINLIPGVDIALPKEVKIDRFKPQLYAEGGFPDKGQLFIANEAGPELVGSMDGKSVVANNDQIIRGIEDASYRGMMKAFANSGGMNTTVNIDAKGDASGLMNFITFTQKQKNRQYGLD